MSSTIWISVIISLGLGALSFFLRFLVPNLKRSIAAIGVACSIIVTGFGIFEALTPPDVTLRVYYPTDPAIVLFNLSDKVARDIKYGGLLLNTNSPELRAHLPIPYEAFDFLRPKENSALEPFTRFPGVRSAVREGDHVFGWQTVSCPECAHSRSYWIYLDWGRSGWYSEMADGARPDTKWLLQVAPEIAISGDAALTTIPESLRTQIVMP